jgi:hypothetical protein
MTLGVIGKSAANHLHPPHIPRAGGGPTNFEHFSFTGKMHQTCVAMSYFVTQYNCDTSAISGEGGTKGNVPCFIVHLFFLCFSLLFLLLLSSVPVPAMALSKAKTPIASTLKVGDLWVQIKSEKPSDRVDWRQLKFLRFLNALEVAGRPQQLWRPRDTKPNDVLKQVYALLSSSSSSSTSSHVCMFVHMCMFVGVFVCMCVYLCVFECF